MKRTVCFVLFLALNICMNPVQVSALEKASFELPSFQPTLINACGKALPAVVVIAKKINSFDLSCGPDYTGYYEFFRPFYEWAWPDRYFHGSGFFISDDGYIVTNAHVVEDATELLVAVPGKDDRIEKAIVIGSDFRTDVAVLKVENTHARKFPYLKFEDSNNTRVGEQVILVGTPIDSIFEATVTTGIVSAKERNNLGIDAIEGYIQTDAAMNGGNSGGPLLNLEGNVIGMAVMGFSRYEGINFAIPSNTIKHVTKQIIANGRALQGFFGVILKQENEALFDLYELSSENGACIKRVIETSPAYKAGLKDGDRVIEVDGCLITSAEALRNHLCVLEPNAKVYLTVDRDGDIFETPVTLSDQPLDTVDCHYLWEYVLMI